MIERIVEYVSKHLWFGEENDPSDVKIKYLANEEKTPYWYIYRDEGNYIFDIDEILALRSEVTKAGGELKVVVLGFYIDPVDKKVAGKMYCQGCRTYKEDVVIFPEGSYCMKCRYDKYDY